MPLELVLSDGAKIVAAPCPFCGSHEIDINCSADDGASIEEADSAWLHCEECFCCGPMADIGCRDEEDGVDLEKEAYELWNERATVLQ